MKVKYTHSFGKIKQIIFQGEKVNNIFLFQKLYSESAMNAMPGTEHSSHVLSDSCIVTSGRDFSTLLPGHTGPCYIDKAQLPKA